MKISNNISFRMMCGLIFMTAINAQATTVTYTLDNVILDDRNTQMTGTFSWTFDIGDFENGEGIFSSLDIPFTLHDHTDLEASFDIGKSIEITFPGNVHDDGIDITLVLLQPLTPTTSSSIDLEESKYDIGGNGFHRGSFLSGSVSVLPDVPGDTDGNRIVNDIDYNNLAAQFGGPPGADSADFNGDIFVGLDDFAVMRGNVGFGVAAAPDTEFRATIPEPTTLTLVALSGLAVLRPRRKR